LTLEKLLYAISEDDLKQLVENQVLEKKNLDYKLLLPSNADGEKKEFLADVSSFANSSGGDLLFGITQDNATGLPKEIVGLDSLNIDKEILRLESIVRDGIEPRIPSVAIHAVKLTNSNTVLIMRIQRSWVLPHRIKFLKSYRFYSRGTNGKYELDIGELRNAFTVIESLNERIKKFRENRVSSIFSNELPMLSVPFYNNAKVVLHLVPLVAFNPSTSYDIKQLKTKSNYYQPMYCSSWNNRYNLEGLLSYSVGSSGLSHSYTQFYRNGIVEAVDALLLEPQGSKKEIPSIAYEQEIIKTIKNYISALQFLNVELPIVVFVTFIDAKGYSMTRRESELIDRDILLLPEVILESYNINVEQALRPIFDSVWNACGFSQSLNYNDKGEWKPIES
jgi:hypothetical protein